jgi:hypothetical protein
MRCAALPPSCRRGVARAAARADTAGRPATEAAVRRPVCSACAAPCPRRAQAVPAHPNLSHRARSAPRTAESVQLLCLRPGVQQRWRVGAARARRRHHCAGARSLPCARNRAIPPSRMFLCGAGASALRHICAGTAHICAGTRAFSLGATVLVDSAAARGSVGSVYSHAQRTRQSLYADRRLAVALCAQPTHSGSL